MDASGKFWNKIAASYAKQPIANLEAYHAKLDATKACLKPGDVILDVGCGTGLLALELSAFVSEVHAIDLSSEMIKIANQKASDRHIDNVTFHNATLADLLLRVKASTPSVPTASCICSTIAERRWTRFMSC